MECFESRRSEKSNSQPPRIGELGQHGLRLDGETKPFACTPALTAAEDAPEWDESVVPLFKKLERFTILSVEEKLALQSATTPTHGFDTSHILIHEGEERDHLVLLTRGLACSYRMLRCGRRQILGYIMPGDFCDIEFSGVGRPGHSVALMCRSEIACIAKLTMRDIAENHPAIGRALSLAALADQAILRGWLVNLGQRNAMERLSHFFCEISIRLSSAGWSNADGSIELPINQEALADTVGLTTVHINRTLQRLRSEGLIALRRHRLTILEPARLAEIAGFEEKYLCVARCGE